MGRCIDATTEIAGVADPAFIHPVRAEGVNIAEIGIPLAPNVILLRPDNAASGVDRIDSGGLKDFTGEAVFLRKVLIDFQQKLIGVVRRGDIALGEVSGCVGQRDKGKAAVRVNQILYGFVQHTARNHIA
jgi:hypothetical protein